MSKFNQPISPEAFEIYTQEIDELSALGLMNTVTTAFWRQFVSDGLAEYYLQSDTREPDE